MNETVKYKNEINTVVLRKFNSSEMDLLFTIFSKIKEKDCSKIIFTFEQLKTLSNYKSKNKKDFINDLQSTYNKLIQLNFKIETESKITRFVLFTEYEIDIDNETIDIQVHEKFKYLLNDFVFGTNFTVFELEEFTTLKSSYSKTMYRLLKQFRTTGKYIVKIEDFRILLDVPDCYSMSDIDKRVLKYISKELSIYFKNLNITKLKGKGKRIRYIEKLIFTFTPEKTEIYNPNKYKKQETVIKKNKFHNFEGNLDNLSDEDLKNIAAKKLEKKLKGVSIPDHFADEE